MAEFHRRAKPYIIEWPLTAESASGIDEMFDILFTDVKIGLETINLDQIVGDFGIGDVIIATSDTVLEGLPDVTVGSYLRSGGVDTVPVWSTLKLPNAAIAGDILFSEGTNAFSAVAGNTQFVPYTGATANINLGSFNLVTTGQIGIGTATVAAPAALTVKGIHRVQQASDIRYRSDLGVAGGEARLNAFDDTGGVYIPLNVDAIYVNLASQVGQRVGVGVVPTAALHLKAGTTAVNTAPLKFNSGSLLTVSEAGAVEFLTDAFYGTITTGATRKTFAFLESPSFTTPALGVATATEVAVTGIVSATVNNVIASSADGMVIANTTAATAGVPVQVSPRLRFRSQVWNTTTPANNTNDWVIENRPVSAATPVGEIYFRSSLNGAALTTPFKVDSNGNLTLLSGIILAAGAFRIQFGAAGFIGTQADGKFNWLTAAGTVGAGIDITTDALLKIRTRAQTGYATVDALAYQVSGVAGASFGPGAVTSITVVNGIVTAIS